MDDDIGAEIDRPLNGRTGERVVHDDDDVVAMGDLARRRQVGQSQHRVGRGLQEQHAASSGRKAASIAFRSEVSTYVKSNWYFRSTRSNSR